jgi:biopolymer transport protein ExbD
MQDAGPWSPSRIAIQRAEKRRPNYLVFLNLWPFVAVLVVLLSIFLVDTTPYHYRRWAPVELPVVLHALPQPHVRRDDAIIISISRDGQLYLGNGRILPGDISSMVRDAVKAGSERKIYLAADSRAKYGDVNAVVDQIRLSGVSQICFLAEKPRSAVLQ